MGHAYEAGRGVALDLIDWCLLMVWKGHVLCLDFCVSDERGNLPIRNAQHDAPLDHREVTY